MPDPDQYAIQLGEDSRRLLAAALADDSEELHRLASALGVSMRTTLYWAGWRMINALGLAEMRNKRLTDYAASISVVAAAILAGDTETLGRYPDRSRDDMAARLVRDRMITTDGELTEDGRDVLLCHEMLTKLRDQHALSDKDMCHE